MSTIQIGSIGIGAISQEVHLPGIQSSDDLRLIAVCDTDAKALEYAQNVYGVTADHCFSDYHALIRCPDVQAIDISTPNDMHFEMAMEAAEAGKPFALEKPVTLNARQAEELLHKVEERKVKNMICFSYRFKAAARYARQLIKNGTLGRLYHVDMQYYQAWGLPRFETPLVWRFVKEHAGSGALGDLGSHALDLVRFVTGLEYRRISSHLGRFTDQRKTMDGGRFGTVDVDDYANYFAEMDQGVAAAFRITRFGFGRGNFQRMDVYGSEGALTYSLDEAGDGRDTLSLCLGEKGSSSCQFMSVDIPKEYYCDQMQSFADIVLGQEDGLSANIYDGFLNQRLLDAVIRSDIEKTWITL